MNTLILSVWVSSLIIFKVVLSVVSYEGYFKSYIYKGEQLLVKEITWKDKLISFMGHFINVDSYMFYLSKIGTPCHERVMPFSKGIKIFNIANMIIRSGLILTCGYFLSLKEKGDLNIISGICLFNSIFIILGHLFSNQYMFEKITGCMIGCVDKILRK
jgi:hypothetical protein